MFRYRRRPDRRVVIRMAALLLVCSLLAFVLAGTVRMRPLLESLATTRVSNTVNRIISEAVNEAIQRTLYY